MVGNHFVMKIKSETRRKRVKIKYPATFAHSHANDATNGKWNVVSKVIPHEQYDMTQSLYYYNYQHKNTILI